MAGSADNYPGVGIRTIGGYLPERVVTNAELEQTLDTTSEWIEQHIGVRTRRWAAPDEWTSDMGAAALLDACAKADVEPDSLDLVICGTYTPDHMSPPAAVALMRKAGVRSGVAGFDINCGGCPGGVFALDLGAKYVAAGYRRVAVVLSDVTSKIFDPEDRTVAVIFGDGAACYLLEPTVPGTGVGPALLRSSPETYETAYVKRERRHHADGSPKQSGFGDQFTYMHGRSVREFALDVIPGFVEELLKAEDMTVDDVDQFITHQANYHLIHLMMQRLGLPPDKTVTTAQKYGNTSGSGLALALSEAVETGRVTPGDTVVLTAFGSGMSHGGLVVDWPSETDFR